MWSGSLSLETTTLCNACLIPADCPLFLLNVVHNQTQQLKAPLALTPESLTGHLTRMCALLEREDLPDLAEAFRVGAGIDFH